MPVGLLTTKDSGYHRHYTAQYEALEPVLTSVLFWDQSRQLGQLPLAIIKTVLKKGSKVTDTGKRKLKNVKDCYCSKRLGKYIHKRHNATSRVRLLLRVCIVPYDTGNS